MSTTRASSGEPNAPSGTCSAPSPESLESWIASRWPTWRRSWSDIHGEVAYGHLPTGHLVLSYPSRSSSTPEMGLFPFPPYGRGTEEHTDLLFFLAPRTFRNATADTT